MCKQLALLVTSSIVVKHGGERSSSFPEQPNNNHMWLDIVGSIPLWSLPPILSPPPLQSPWDVFAPDHHVGFCFHRWASTPTPTDIGSGRSKRHGSHSCKWRRWKAGHSDNCWYQKVVKQRQNVGYADAYAFPSRPWERVQTHVGEIMPPGASEYLGRLIFKMCGFKGFRSHSSFFHL